MSLESANFDTLYIQEWEASVYNCLEDLESDDRRQVESVTDVQAAFEKIAQSLPSGDKGRGSHSRDRFLRSLNCLQTFSSSFKERLDSRVEIISFWGMIYLAVKLGLELNVPVPNLGRMLKEVGRKVDSFKIHLQKVADSSNSRHQSEVKDHTLEVQMELLAFFKDLVILFRSGTFDFMEKNAWSRASNLQDRLIHSIDESFRSVSVLAELAETNTGSRAEEIAGLQQVISLSLDALHEEVTLPCHVLPFVRHPNFHDREEIIKLINEHFEQPCSESRRPRATALYGHAGIGKSHVAMKYAYSKQKELDAIFWVYSTTAAALAQSFTDIAIRLGLPTANSRNDVGNRILLRSWLQRTHATWLLVFDNAENADLLLEYWPWECDGRVILTCRDHNLSFEPAGHGIEIPPFNPRNGAEFVLSLLSTNTIEPATNGEHELAMELSEILGGHALALSQMAGLIHARSWSMEDFLRIYKRDTQRIHQSVSLNTLWKLSFESLDKDASALLGVMSYLMPDSIDQKIFEPKDPAMLPSDLRFCRDEISFSKTIESLMILALTKRDKTTRALSVHRLVQTEFKYHLEPSKQQSAFNSASKILNNVFPRKPRSSHQMYDVWEDCQSYLQHVLNLTECYKIDRGVKGSLKPSMDFCDLLVRCARYLGEICHYPELANMLDVASSALEVWEDSNNYPLMTADILRHNSTMWLQRGNFGKSSHYMTQSIEIYEKYRDQDPCLLLAPYNHMGNVAASANRYEDSLIWQKRTEQLHQRFEEDSMKRTALTNLNLGRCLWLLGDVDGARTRYESAIKKYRGSANWAMHAL